jgi:RNAse (barnase) inhibitor barstar
MVDDEKRKARAARKRISVGPLTPKAAADVCRKAERQGWNCAHIDLDGCVDKKDLLQRIAAALEFPQWFGGNWDALFDCLADLSWRPAAGHLLLLENTDALKREAPEVFDTAVAILQDVAVYWSRRNVTFRAFVGVKSGKQAKHRASH